MAFPYQQYVEYSNPATPRVYAWEVASATSDQDPSLHLQQQPQDPQPQPPPQQISPSQLQLHQLPPPLLQHAQPSTPQEHQVQQQLHQQSHQQPQPQPHPQPQQHQQYASHQTIHVLPASRTPQQPQYRFETITEEDFIQASATGERPGSGSSSRGGGSGNARRAMSKPPPLHVDTSRRASSSAAASPAPASAPALAPGTGGRVPHARTHAHAQSLSTHPYLRRPQSRMGSSGAGVGASAGAGVAGPSGQQQRAPAPAPVRSARRVSELQSAQTSVGGVSASHTGGALPTVGTPMGVSCPASGSWRDGMLGLSTGSGGARCVVGLGVPLSLQPLVLRGPAFKSTPTQSRPSGVQARHRKQMRNPTCQQPTTSSSRSRWSLCGPSDT